MFKNKTVLETKRNDRAFTLTFEQPSSLTELIDVLCELRSTCVNALEQSIAQEEAKYNEKVEAVKKDEPEAVEEQKGE